MTQLGSDRPDRDGPRPPSGKACHRFLTVLVFLTVLDNNSVDDTRALRHVEIKTRILDAAWRLARQNGLAALSLRDLAQEVGMRGQDYRE